MAYTMCDTEIEVNSLIFSCSGQVEFDYEGGDPGDYYTPPVGASANDISIILDEVHDDEDKEVTDPKVLEDISQALKDYYNDNQDILTDDWEETAMETAAANRYDEMMERMNDDY